MNETKTKKVPVRDLKPSKDAKGGRHHHGHGHHHSQRSGREILRADTPGRGIQL